MKFSFRSGDETITLTHLPNRRLLYAPGGMFKPDSPEFSLWKKYFNQNLSIPFGANAYQLFGKPIGLKSLTAMLAKSLKQNLAGKQLNLPQIELAQMFQMSDGDITACNYEYIIGFRREKSAYSPADREKFRYWFDWQALQPVWKEMNCYVVRTIPKDLPAFFEGINALQSYQEDIAYVHPNFIGRLCLNTTDPNYQKQWAINPAANLNGLSPKLTVNVEKVWNRITTGGISLSPTRLMVLDQGIYSHQDISFNSLSTTNSVLSHGTKVAGIMGALQNTLGITGLSPNPGATRSTAFDLVGQNFPSEYDVISSEQVAVDQAKWVKSFLSTVASAQVKPKVLNLSFNFLGYPGTSILKSSLETLAKDMLICVSAGNYKNDGAHGLEDVPGYPAYLPGIVLPVGAIDIQGRRVTIANYGWSSKYNFPGNEGVMAPGTDIFTTDRNNGIDTAFSGTSASVAFVSGIAALLFSINKNPGLKPSDMRSILLSTASASQMVPANPAPKYVGKGVIDADAAMTRMLHLFP